MRNMKELIRPIVLAVVVSSAGACSSSGEAWSYYPNNFPWFYNDYGVYTTVGRPRLVVDTWTTRTFNDRPYRGYALTRHNSPVIVHTASKDDEVFEVRLTEVGDSTYVEIRAMSGAGPDPEQAKLLMGQILHEYR